ncbi:hypothetical protein IWQ60_005141 [Tieghemiomyces parasiticus]|uniref:CS domain-containing protein n=1 Tax=Tieghemiomyces parasiticus TaxID=78921 RepID=A0A9W8DUW3_9FUNG|nr:hypothetical protein IWQ60_005141 [Tieghemiomyces parasiticus]
MVVNNQNASPVPGDPDAAFQQFVAVHRTQLQAIGFPDALQRELYEKLTHENFDAGRSFALAETEENDKKALSQYHLVVKADQVAKESAVYLIDHAWATTLKDPYQMLLLNDALLERLASVVGVDLEEKESNNGAEADATTARPADITPEEWEQLIEMVMTEGHVSRPTAEQLLIKEDYEVLNAIQAATYIEEQTPMLQTIKENILGQVQCTSDRLRPDGGSRHVLSSDHLVPNMPQPTEEWATRHYTCRQYSEPAVEGGRVEYYVEVRALVGPGLRASDVECEIKTHHLRLVIAGRQAVIDGELYAAVVPDDSTWTIESGEVVITLKKQDGGGSLWPELVHQETRFDMARRQAQARTVADALAPFLQAYKYVHVAESGETRQDVVWYVMDEVGNAIIDSRDPNCACYSFLYCSPTSGAINAYNLLWPLANLQQGEVVTRDYRLTRPVTL